MYVHCARLCMCACMCCAERCVCALCKVVHVLCREVCMYVQGCVCVPASGCVCVSLHEGAWVCAEISAAGLD